MNTYEIRITNLEDANEMSTFTVTAEDMVTLLENLETTANYSEEIELELIDGTVLEISQHAEHGYNANLYENRTAFEDGDDPINGGLCTGTITNAINMAIN